MPKSRAVALRESPLDLACRTFSHRVLWRAVGILCCCALDLRGLKSRSTSPVCNVARRASHWPPAPLMPRAGPELSGGAGGSFPQHCRARRSLLGWDGLSLVLHQELATQVLWVTSRQVA